MSTTTVTGDSNTIDTTGKPDNNVTYVLGLAFAIIILLFTLSYASYKCRRDTRSSSPPEGDDQRFRTTLVSRGVDDDVLKTFPEFVYSEVMMAGKGDSLVDANGSGCSICLADYKPADVIRLLPECGHLFHRKCIDKWLRVHPTCPVCRNSPLLVKLAVQPS
ncbi:putative transcription factor C2H2 family [Helianthus annuus]|nr:putative transcription factor C2H2 family [Helianthus annuus]